MDEQRDGIPASIRRRPSTPVEGRRAVAQVVLNRLRHPAFPKSVCGVVYQGAGSGVCQFTFVCDGSLYRAPARDNAQRESAIVAGCITLLTTC